MKNIIQNQLTAADRTVIGDALTEIETTIAGKTGVLSDEERRRYGSINEQNKLVVNKAFDYNKSQPALSSPNVDWAEFDNDYEARAFLENCINRLNAIKHKFESTKIMHDYDNFQDALKDYGYSQYQLGAGEDDYAAKVDEYKQFFTRSNDSKPPKDGENE